MNGLQAPAPVIRAGAARRSGQPDDIPVLINPGTGYVDSKAAFGTWLGLHGMRLLELGTLPQGRLAQRLLAFRYVVANGQVWLQRFQWKGPLLAAIHAHNSSRPDDTRGPDATVADIESTVATIAAGKESLGADAGAHLADVERLFAGPLRSALARGEFDEATRRFLMLMNQFPSLRERAAQLLRAEAAGLVAGDPVAADLLYLATFDLRTYPATSVSAGQLKYVIVADKGEMGVRAVREALAMKKVPVVCFSMQDDADSMQVRIARQKGGILVGLSGNFRESYANFEQIAEKVHAAFTAKFGERAADELTRAALYPGYGPLAENAAAIRHFRKDGIVFIGPMQDVVENAGDKRRFRSMAQDLDPEAVTPGITIGSTDPEVIHREISAAHAAGRFTFPGRLKAANGGGGRGQAVIGTPDGVQAAITKVLGEIRANGWDPGVMFEQNIADTIHLEVQVVRDRYGNARHFGMRDCSEQRASQKIQEEAPPALLARHGGLRLRIEELAVQIAHRVGYVGAGTVELMFKDGKFYFLEMNTRIQVEHPVSEESHGIARNGKTEPLNLVRLQMQIADGLPLDFAQADVVQTHVAREYRINAESWNPNLKDSRDGKVGLFVPNAGVFDTMKLPDRTRLLKALKSKDVDIVDLKVRFDCGFETGDKLVNKDPTFGKLIVAVKSADPAIAYEALRLASLAVLKQLKIAGRQVMPDGGVIAGSTFRTNIPEHIQVLESQLIRDHCRGRHDGRHVNWVVGMLRAG